MCFRNSQPLNWGAAEEKQFLADEEGQTDFLNTGRFFSQSMQIGIAAQYSYYEVKRKALRAANRRWSD